MLLKMDLCTTVLHGSKVTLRHSHKKYFKLHNKKIGSRPAGQTRPPNARPLGLALANPNDPARSGN